MRTLPFLFRLVTVLVVAVPLERPRELEAQVASAPESLGTVRFETSCPAGARAGFDRAVALLHHMTYSGARAAFASIASEYPTCAMAHWGVAMTLFQPLWPTRPTPEDLRRGWQEVAEARHAGPTTPREAMYLAAVGAFFDPAVPDYWTRVGRWAEASRTLHEAYPDDVEAEAFYALSILATAPATGDLSHQEDAAVLLDDILSTHPDHPGALHYTVHACDAPGREHVALDVVRRYARIAPRNPHALHMPTHIFVRLGSWSEAIEGNRRAAAAALENPAGDAGQWVWDEYPHALEYLVYALLQVGDDEGARRAMVELQATARLQPSFKTAFHLTSIPARYALERGDWTAAATLPSRPDPTLVWDDFPWPEAVTWFARGVGAARTGDVVAARAAQARLVELRGASERSGETLFARQTEILRLGVSAWLALAEGRGEDAVGLMGDAASLDAATPKPPVTPGATLPPQEMLGDLLLELGRPAEALRAYRASLAASPGRLNGLVGAGRAAHRSGEDALARTYYRALLDQAVPSSSRAEVREAAAFLGSAGP